MTELSIPQTKCCTKCAEIKPLAEFRKDPTKKDGLYSSCRTCCRKQARERRLRDLDASRAAEKVYRDSRRDELNALQRARYAKNPDPIRERNRNNRRENLERFLESERKSYQKKKGLGKGYKKGDYQRKKHSILASGLRRKARKLSLPDSFSVADWRYALDYFNGCCAVCGRPPGLWHIMSMDHWIPLNNPDCPGTVPTNIVPLCHGDGGCNNSKKASDSEAWLVRKFGKKIAYTVLSRVNIFFDSLCQH